MKCYVYILHSPSSDKFYVGQTANLEQRLLEHNETSTKSFTSKYRPWILKTSFEMPSRSAAMKLEKYLKKKNRAFLQRAFDDIPLQEYLLNKFSSDG